MSLIEEALKRQAAKDDTAAEKKAAAERKEVDEHRDKLAEDFCLPVVVVSEPLVVIATRHQWVEAFMGRKTSEYVPDRKTLPYHFLVSDEVRIAWYWDNNQRIDRLIRTCRLCGKLGHGSGSFAVYTSDSADCAAHQEGFLNRLGQVMAQDFLCAFCEASEKGKTCPTCRRAYGWDL